MKKNKQRLILRIIVIFITLFILTRIGSCIKTASFKHSESQTGIASFYASGFHGKKTASGEIFSNRKYTAAHRKLPFGTKVKVTNLSNNKKVIVKIRAELESSGKVEEILVEGTKKAGAIARENIARVREMVGL